MIKKKILSLLLAFAMVIGILPFGEMVAYAADSLGITSMRITIEKELLRDANGNPILSNGAIAYSKSKTSILVEGSGFVQNNMKIDRISILKPTGTEMNISSNYEIKAGTIGITLDENESITSGGTYEVKIDYTKNGSSSYAEKSIVIGNILSAEEVRQESINLGQNLEVKGNIAEGHLELRQGNIAEYIGTFGEEPSTAGFYVKEVGKAPGNIPGVKDIYIHNANPTSTTSPTSVTIIRGGIQVFPKPGELEVTDVSPTSGPVSGGTRVRFTGEGLSSSTRIEFGTDGQGYRTALNPSYSNGVLTVTTPGYLTTGPVNIRINGDRAYLNKDTDKPIIFVYTATDASLSVQELRPNSGTNLGGETVSIRGRNFQTTIAEVEGQARQIVSNESEVKIDGDTKLIFTKKLGDGETRPTTWPEGATKRVREITVFMGGEDPVKFKALTGADYEAKLNSMIDRVTGMQTIKIETPLFPAEQDTKVDLVVTAVNRYFNSLGDEIEVGLEREEARADFEFLVPRNPMVQDISISSGPIASGDEEKTNRAVMHIQGDDFVVRRREVGDETVIEGPQIFLVPQTENFNSDTTIRAWAEEIKQDEDNDNDNDLKPYEAYLKDNSVYLEKNSRIVRVDGVADRIGTEMSVILPEHDAGEEVRQLIILNPDGGIRRIQDAFIYRSRGSEPEITSVNPKVVDAQGGEKVTLRGKGINTYDGGFLITVDGKVAEVLSAEDIVEGSENIQEFVFEAPKGSVGKKIVQVINLDQDGTQVGLDSYSYYRLDEDETDFRYTRVTTNPKIDVIAPNYGGAGAKVIIKGSGFQTAQGDNPGTAVYFDGYKLKNGVDEASIVVEDSRTIKITMPSGLPLGFKDVTVENPDTARYTVQDGFNYLRPQSSPTITKVDPDYGTINGGTIVTIEGSGFLDEVEVFFNEKKGINPVVNGEGTEIRVVTPDYPIPNANTDSIAVDLTVVNYDGGAATEIEGFEYRLPGSFPEITQIDPAEGTTAGGTRVVIRGKDFRIEDSSDPENPNLPIVYFGGVKAKEVKYVGQSQLIVTTPTYTKPEAVDVIIVNPDAGTVVKEKGFTYKKSTPKIQSVTPPVIDRHGNTRVTVIGSGFIKGEYSNLKDIEKEDLHLEAIFGNERATDTIVAGQAEINIGNLKVSYNAEDPQNTEITSYAGFEEKAFLGRISEGNPLFKAIKTSGESKINEGIKVSRAGNTLIVERRASIKVEWINENTIDLVSPPMDGVGIRDLAIRNLDGGEAKTKVEVKNPASKPVIIDIEPKKSNMGPSGEVTDHFVDSTLDGGITFTIKGADFRTGAKVFIGDQEAEIIAKGPNDDSLTVRSPKGKASDVGKQLKIIVVNVDGGIADSSTGLGTPRAPGYYIYREAESSPKVTKIDPNKGSAIGGERVVITGEDFRPESGVEVKFGDRFAEVVREESNYEKLVVITPPSDIYGAVDVHIRNTNALGETIVRGGFIYTSAPVIIKLEPDLVYSSGGEKVEIIGKGFQSGAKVNIGGEAVEAEFVDEFKLIITTPKVELPKGVDSVKKDVTVINPDGGETTKKDGITFTRPFPMRPIGFKATPQHGRTMLLEWKKVDIIERYRLEVSESENGPYKYLAEVSGGEYLARDLKPDTKYYFRLWALNEYGQSQGFATANNKTYTNTEDNQSGEFEDITDSQSQVIESSGNVTINYAKKYTTEDYTHDLTASKYSSYRTITLNIPASVVNSGSGTLTLKHRDFELKSALSMFKSPERSYSSGEILRVTVTKLFDGEQSTALKFAPAGYAAQKQGVKIEYTVGDGRNNTALQSINGVYLTTYVDKASLSELANYSYKPGESSLQKEQSNYSKVYSDVYKKEIYKLSSYIKRSGYYIPLGK